MSPEVLANIREYSELPETPEKNDIDRKYLNDEINDFTFYATAMDYMRRVKESEGLK